MYEDDIFSPDQEEIFKDDFACLQAINLTAFTTGDLVFMCVKKSVPVWWCPWHMVNTWNTLVNIEIFCNIYNLHPIGHRNEGYEIHEEMRHIWDMRDTRDIRFMKNIRDMRDIWDLRVMRKMMILLQIFTKCYWLTDWLTEQIIEMLSHLKIAINKIEIAKVELEKVSGGWVVQRDFSVEHFSS